MKKITLSTFLFFGLMMLNAQQEEVNAFQQSENQATGTTSGSSNPLRSTADNQVQSGPGNLPGDDEIPIDDYLPLLFLAGSAIIVYLYKSKKIKSA